MGKLCAGLPVVFVISLNPRAVSLARRTHSKTKKVRGGGSSLECGGLAPLWPEVRR